MRLGSAKRYGVLATVALLVATLVVTGFGLGAQSALAIRGHAGGSTASSAGAGHFVDFGVPRPAATFNVTITNAPQAYLVLPATINWTITGASPVAKSSDGMMVNIRDVIGSGVCTGTLSCPTVANISDNSSIVNGTTSYSLTISASNLTATNYNGGVLPPDEYQIYVWVTVSGASAGAERNAFIVPAAPSGAIAAPITGIDVSTGNVTVAVNYSGSYLAGATVSIYQGTTDTGKVVYSQGVFAPGTGAHVVVSNVPWVVTVPGQYFVELNLSTPYAPGTYSFSQLVTVVAAGATVYQNQSSWSNGTLFPGVSPAVGGTILLVIGLIVGMIVALVLGRMMWGSPKPVPAVQTWQQTKTTTTNECSVCHQTFATPEELTEHQKTAHGMA